jgi:hypothetical protein
MGQTLRSNEGRIELGLANLWAKLFPHKILSLLSLAPSADIGSKSRSTIVVFCPEFLRNPVSLDPTLANLRKSLFCAGFSMRSGELVAANVRSLLGGAALVQHRES